jgi:hypothetical protein
MNGFISPDLDELKVFQPVGRKKASSSLVALDASHLKQFPKMVQFAKSVFPATEVFCKMFYNFKSNVFEMKIFNKLEGTDCICLQFHQMETLDHEYDPDYWLEA